MDLILTLYEDFDKLDCPLKAFWLPDAPTV